MLLIEYAMVIMIMVMEQTGTDRETPLEKQNESQFKDTTRTDNGHGINTDTSPPRPEQGANTNTNVSDPSSTAASPTSIRSTDTRTTAEDSMFSRQMDKLSLCENCSTKDTRIKVLEDRIRELILQLTSQSKYINELLNREQENTVDNNIKERISSIQKELDDRTKELADKDSEIAKPSVAPTTASGIHFRYR